MPVRTRDILAWLHELQRVYSTHRQHLTDLDAAIGDADHGANLDRGFTAVSESLRAAPPADIGSALQTTASVLIRTVGGASGPLYGTFFLRAAGVCKGKAEIDAADFAALFEAGIEGVRQRGRAERGDKTMLDALLPAAAAMQQALAERNGCAAMLAAGAAAARHGAEATIPMTARKGRASYLGERSSGHQDPGAFSAYLLLQAAADVLCL